jgi:hypothetical protein
VGERASGCHLERRDKITIEENMRSNDEEIEPQERATMPLAQCGCVRHLPANEALQEFWWGLLIKE